MCYLAADLTTWELARVHVDVRVAGVDVVDEILDRHTVARDDEISVVVGLEVGAAAGVHAPVSACASGAEAIAWAWRMLKADEVDVVYHAAAAVWNPSLPHDIYESVNLEGTRNVIEVCRGRGIRRMVFTSSMDVVVDGRRPIVDGDESLPYPSSLPKDPYSRSKIRAEQDAAAVVTG